MSSITISAAVANDLEEIANIHYHSWQAAYKNIIPASFLSNLDKNEYHQNWKTWFKADINLLLIKDNNKVKGFISFSTKANEGEITALYIDPAAYRKGYGTLLLNQALSNMHKLGIQKVILWVLDKNVMGKNFYQKNGFIISTESRYEDFDNQQLKEVCCYKLFDNN